MKVLFVSSGNSNNFKVSPFIQSQGESLVEIGLALDYFTIKRKGFIGYLKESIKLRKYLKNASYDIIHAHYALSAWVVVFAFPKQPIVLSLMGDDANGTYYAPGKLIFKSRFLILLTFFLQFFVDKIICKTHYMQRNIIQKKKTVVLPNGVNLDVISSILENSDSQLSLDKSKKYVLFLGNKNDINKNYTLVEQAMLLIDSTDIEFLAPFPVSHKEVIAYLNAVDVLVLTSLMEGSPNVVKEAMGSNCSVVATNVGDVAWLFGNEPGYFITDFNPMDCADNIMKALAFVEMNGKPNGRQRIINLKLETKDVAYKLYEIYKTLI